MQRILPLLVGTAVLAFVALPSPQAAADDETGDTQIKIQAPLDAVDCTANTISVLGLTIDISSAAIDGQSGDGGDQGDNQEGDQTGGGDGSGDGNDQGGDDGGDGGSGGGGCATLVAGQTVDVRLASDSAPLMATEVRQGDDSNAKVKAPIQGVDATGHTITVLGLVVDVSQANMNGADDDAEDGNSQPVDLSQAMPGQFVEMTLASSQAPLAATEVRLLNFTNQIDLEVDDSNGDPVDDMDDNGNPVDDVEVDVDETVMVQATTPGAAPTTRHVRKVLHLHQQSNGSVTLTGLATGRAKISLTRTAQGVRSVGRRSVAVRPNTQRHVRVRLHHVK